MPMVAGLLVSHCQIRMNLVTLSGAGHSGSNGDETLRKLLIELETVNDDERQRLIQSTLELLGTVATVVSEN